MKTLKLIIIATAICSLFIIGVQKIDAFEITYFEVYSDTDYGSGANATAYVNTDEDIICIRWSVDDVYSHTTHYGAGTRFASEIFRFTGDIKGNKHKITAEVWFWDGNNCVSDPDSYTFRVFQPKIISGTKKPVGVPKNKQGEGIYGYVELARHYHVGQNIVVEGYLYARNRTEVPLNAASWLRHTQFDINDGKTLWTMEDPDPGRQLLPGEAYSNSGSLMISFPVEGGDIDRGVIIKLNAHIHLQVGGQVWHEENNAWTHEFTYKDNESYEEGD